MIARENKRRMLMTERKNDRASLNARFAYTFSTFPIVFVLLT